MKFRLRATRLVAGLVVIACAAGCTHKPHLQEPIRNQFNESNTNSWLIQYARGPVGEQRLYVAPKKYKMEMTKLGISVVVLEEPVQTVFVYSEPDRLVYNSSIGEWRKQREEMLEKADTAFKRSIGAREDTVFKKGAKDETIMGLNAKHYVGTGATHYKDGSTDEITTDLWVTDEIKAPQEFFAFVGPGAKGLPSGSVPLRMILTMKDKKMMVLDTAKAIKMALPDSSFSTPMGYKVVPTEMAVLEASQERLQSEYAENPTLVRRVPDVKKDASSEPHRKRRTLGPSGEP